MKDWLPWVAAVWAVMALASYSDTAWTFCFGWLCSSPRATPPPRPSVVSRNDWLDLERRFREIGARYLEQRRRLFISKDFTNHYIVRTEPWDDVVVKELEALCINAGQMLAASSILLPKVVAHKTDPIQRWSWYLRTEGESKLHGFVIDHIAHTSARACLKLAGQQVVATL